MAVLLGHMTALEYWRSLATMRDARLHDALVGSQAERRRITNMLQQKLAAAPSRQDSLAYLADYPDADVITVGKHAHSRNAFLLSRRIASLPAHSCVQANAHHQAKPLYVCTPEFCFLQMAQQLSLEELIALGFELCGTYAIQNEGTVYDALPLTTPEKLKAFLSHISGAKGIAPARRAAKYIIAGSASPMETALAMFLTLPYSLGGYGFSQPQLNYRIDIPASLANVVRSHYFVCDLFWPDASLAIEYDSNLAHAGINRTVHDSMRQSVLTGIGISVLSVTWPQVKDRNAFEQLAHVVARQTRKRLQYKNPEFIRHHLNLRNKLLYPSAICC